MKSRLVLLLVLIIAVAAAIGAFYYYSPRPLQNFNQNNPVANNPVVNNNVNQVTNENTNAATGPCTINIAQSAPLYMRADAASPIFGQADPSESPQAGGKTADGWLGFDPGVAQAPNVGPFRLRWFAPGAPVSLSGDCSALRVYPNLPPLTCFTMAQTDVPIYKSADAKSQVVATMHYGDYIEVIGRKGPDTNMWVEVKSPTSSLSDGIMGWISGQDVDFNGQNCSNIPTVK